MMAVPKIDRIGFLVDRKFPGLNPLSRDDKIREQLGLPALRQDEKNRFVPVNRDAIQKMEKYRSELSGLDERKLQEVYEQAVYQKNLEDDQGRFFNEASASADFEYWSKMSHWTLDEAIALSFGKNPEIVFLKRLETIPFYQSPFIQEYQKLNELARRAVVWKKLYDPVLPAIFINWARENDIALPEPLVEKVKQRQPDFIDWKQKYSDLLDAYEKQARDFDSYAETAMHILEERNKSNPESSEGTSYIPPYMQFMLDAVTALGLSQEKRTGKSVIVDWLRDNWPADLDGKSERMIESMATMLRSPEHKKGGNTSWKECSNR